VPAGRVTAPAGPVRTRLPRRMRVVLAGLAAAGVIAAGIVALAGGGGAAPSPAPAGLVLLHGLPLQSANCDAWWRAGEGERMTAIQAFTRSIGGATTGGAHGTTLPDARVHRLFDSACTPSFAGHFLLYEIYVRAAGFKSLGPG
jgi:hypothetical protein